MTHALERAAHCQDWIPLAETSWMPGNKPRLERLQMARGSDRTAPELRNPKSNYSISPAARAKMQHLPTPRALHICHSRRKKCRKIQLNQHLMVLALLDRWSGRLAHCQVSSSQAGRIFEKLLQRRVFSARLVALRTCRLARSEGRQAYNWRGCCRRPRSVRSRWLSICASGRFDFLVEIWRQRR
jgi:hypothetical protein